MDHTRGRKTSNVLGLIAAGLLLAGLAIGLIPVSSSGVNCGSAFIASDDAHVADLVGTMSGGLGTQGAAASCDSLRSLVAIPAWVFLGLGATAGVTAMVLRPLPHQETARQE